jgi:hypothetical protein
MSPNLTLLFYLLLEHGAPHDGNDLLLRPLCDDGQLQPPLISEMRALLAELENSRTEPLAGEPKIALERPPRIEFITPYSPFFTPRVPWSHFFDQVLDATSCFG